MMLTKKILFSILKWSAWTALLISLLYLLKPKPLKVDISEVQFRKFQKTIKAEGEIRSKNRHTLYSPADGDVSRISVRVGEPVEKGQVLCWISSDKEWKISSPIQGVVSKVFRDSASPVRRGDPLLEIVDLHQMEIAAEVLTPEALKLKIGMAVLLSGWGGDSTIIGTLSFIHKVGFEKVSALGVEEKKTEIIISVEKNYEGQLKNMGDHFQVDCEIVLLEQNHALTAPLGALFYENKESFVFTINSENKAQKTQVKIKEQGRSDFWIEGGLEQGQKVILYPGEKVKEGMKVRWE